MRLDILDNLAAEFSHLMESKESITIQLSPIQLWAIFSNLQLALRHPNNNRSMSEIAYNTARQIQDIIAPRGALKDLAEMGWNPKYDE